MASRSLEDFLQSGEEIRFEAHARGWAPLTRRMAALYAAVLVFAALRALPGAIDVGPFFAWQIPVPIEATALLMVVLNELVRTAEFRSRLHVITNQRVFVTGGIFRRRVWNEAPIEGVTAVCQIRGIPALIFEKKNRRWSLPGLDALDQESIAAALGRLPALPPIEATFLDRTYRQLALVVAVAFVLLVEGESAIQRRARARFATQWTKVTAAALNAESAFQARAVREEAPRPVRLKSFGGTTASETGFARRSEMTVSFNVGDAQPTSWLVPVRLAISAEQTFELFPGTARIEVEHRTEDRRGNEQFLVELKQAFEAAGIEATWPEASK